MTLVLQRRNARHPVNAILDYACKVLQGRLQIQAISEGYDFNIGIMLETTDGSETSLFDLIEAYRHRVDRNILELSKGHTFDGADDVIRPDAVAGLIQRWQDLRQDRPSVYSDRHGCAYEMFAQLPSRHLGKVNPGQPTMIPVAMPGARGIVALRRLDR